MATTTPINNERHLIDQLDKALVALEQTTGVKGHVVATEKHVARERGADALVDFTIEGKKHRYVVEVKTRVDRFAALGHVKTQLANLGERGLLFAPHITTAIAKQCRQLDLPFLDAAGNAYLHEPGLHVYITGEKPAAGDAPTMGTQRGGTATALRVVFTLLCNPKLLNAPYREIVNAANVALGAIGWVFFDLEKRGYIAGRQKKHNRQFLEAKRVFDEWVTNYPIKLRPKLNPRRFRAENADWWKKVELAKFNACWGGEVAAARLTHYLKPATCTLYIKPHEEKNQLGRLAIENRLRADPTGNIEILDAFWNLPVNLAHPDVAPPILVYADLVATLDPRNLEVAKLIREQHIDNAFD